MKPKHIIVANDISGLGKVALTAALPLFAACQLEVAVLPTVLLSSHTGGFKGVYVEDFQPGMEAFLKQWHDLQVPFSAIVTGYFKSEQQVDLIKNFASQKQVPLLVDPIMGDKGQLYQGFDESFLLSMRALCHQADLVLPNLTEACYLLDLPYPTSPLAEKDYEQLTRRFASQFGVEDTIITGLDLDEEQVGVADFHRSSQTFHLFRGRRIEGHFMGTGDVFTALATAAYVQQLDLGRLIPEIMQFIENSLISMSHHQLDPRMGVYYQPYLGDWFSLFQELLEEKNEQSSK